jgi:hypothetical protein
VLVLVLVLVVAVVVIGGGGGGGGGVLYPSWWWRRTCVCEVFVCARVSQSVCVCSSSSARVWGGGELGGRAGGRAEGRKGGRAGGRAGGRGREIMTALQVDTCSHRSKLRHVKNRFDPNGVCRIFLGTCTLNFVRSHQNESGTRFMRTKLNHKKVRINRAKKSKRVRSAMV